MLLFSLISFEQVRIAKSLLLETTSCSPAKSFTLCSGLTVFDSELEEYDDYRCLPPQPQLLRTLRFLFSADNLGVRRTSNIKTTWSHSSLSSDEVVSLTLQTQMIEVNCLCPDSSFSSCIVLISAQVRNNYYSRKTLHYVGIIP